VDDCLKRIEPHYYVALLSAARHWGSAHYALQDTQVMVGKPRLALTPGRLKVDFFSKRAIAGTPTVVVTSGVAPWCVSTREATLLDLIRHQADIGGIESVARTARDLAPKIELNGLTQALNAMGQVPVAQRLGFIFERLTMKKPAQRVADWLESHRTMAHPLELQTSRGEGTLLVDERWNIEYDVRRLNLFEEIAC
jgi:predicted transcriptional regulator of viral defense system